MAIAATGSPWHFVARDMCGQMLRPKRTSGASAVVTTARAGIFFASLVSILTILAWAWLRKMPPTGLKHQVDAVMPADDALDAALRAGPCLPVFRLP